MVLLLTCKFEVSFFMLGNVFENEPMAVVERGQSEMVNFAINLNRREANEDILV